MFYGFFYDLSLSLLSTLSILSISIKAFLPSLRVLKTSQDRNEIRKMVSVTKERVV